MSSKRFGPKAKKPKDKEKKKADAEAAAAKGDGFTPATKAANFQNKRFQRRTAG